MIYQNYSIRHCLAYSLQQSLFLTVAVPESLLSSVNIQFQKYHTNVFIAG